jgi:hypothetical protein
VRRLYAEAARRRGREFRETIRRAGVDLLELSTGEPYEMPLVHFFHERARRAAIAGG